MKGFPRARRLLAVSIMLVVACGGSPSADPDQTDLVEFEAGPLGAVVVAPGELIHIRSLNSISGDIAFLGIPNQRGVEMAIEDYGPVAGREVSMGTPLDDLCSPEGGQSAAQATVADPSVVGVIGTTCSCRRDGGITADLRCRDGDDRPFQHLAGVDVGPGRKSESFVPSRLLPDGAQRPLSR